MSTREPRLFNWLCFPEYVWLPTCIQRCRKTVFKETANRKKRQQTAFSQTLVLSNLTDIRWKMFVKTHKINLLNKLFNPVRLSVRRYEIPEHLRAIVDDPDPSFYRMVEYFYHNAVKVCEPSLEEYLKKYTHLSDKKRKQRVSGILKVAFLFITRNNVKV